MTTGCFPIAEHISPFFLSYNDKRKTDTAPDKPKTTFHFPIGIDDPDEKLPFNKPASSNGMKMILAIIIFTSLNELALKNILHNQIDTV
jgi:hypothetical protein